MVKDTGVPLWLSRPTLQPPGCFRVAAEIPGSTPQEASCRTRASRFSAPLGRGRLLPDAAAAAAAIPGSRPGIVRLRMRAIRPICLVDREGGGVALFSRAHRRLTIAIKAKQLPDRSSTYQATALDRHQLELPSGYQAPQRR